MVGHVFGFRGAFKDGAADGGFVHGVFSPAVQ